MLKKEVHENDKLLPLRILARYSPYDASYLSILVQRKKLKAQKIGRNYYSTRTWLDDYIQIHASDNKRQESDLILDKNLVDKVKDNNLLTDVHRGSGFFSFITNMGKRVKQLYLILF